jgi:hypothetical protein
VILKSDLNEKMNKINESASKNLEMQLYYTGEFEGEIKLDDNKPQEMKDLEDEADQIPEEFNEFAINHRKLRREIMAEITAFREDTGNNEVADLAE